MGGAQRALAREHGEGRRAPDLPAVSTMAHWPGQPDRAASRSQSGDLAGRCARTAAIASTRAAMERTFLLGPNRPDADLFSGRANRLHLHAAHDLLKDLEINHAVEMVRRTFLAFALRHEIRDSQHIDVGEAATYID